MAKERTGKVVELDLFVEERVYGPLDEYLVVPVGDIQVEEPLWKRGDKVLVMIQIEKRNY